MSARFTKESEPIPGYKLMERLGRGGFGEVWKVLAPGGLHKAIKFVYGDLGGKESRHAADQELRALNRVKEVRHPFILSLERVDVIEGQLVIVMELADRSLGDRMRECHSLGLPGVPREELLRYMDEAAEALDLMNIEHQLQHLDIKPQNLFLVHNHIKVADFGLVKDLQGMKTTVTGGVTPLYAAPETFDGWVSRYCDQYSLAIVYQELLTGQRPFDGTNPGQLVMQHLKQDPDLTALPADDRDVIARALAKKPTDRFPSCSYMVRTLRSGNKPEEINAPVEPLPPPVLPGHPSPSRLQRAPLPADDAPDAPTQKEKPAAEQAINKTVQIRVSPRDVSVTPRSSTPTRAPSKGSQTRHMEMKPSASVEFQGQGVLFPGLVIGLGYTGIRVVQRLRALLEEQFSELDEKLPQIRLLGIDIDPEVVHSALRGVQGMALMADEVYLAKLNRPSHFLRPHDGQEDLAEWFDMQMLYRMPRNQSTAGLRALGRLALVDNYKEITDRLRQCLGIMTDPESLAAADRQTKLGLRINRPRVYIITHLGGGTGSGMFIDMAYLVRSYLQNLGYPQPEIVGVFMLPPSEGAGTNYAMSSANAYAALRELQYFTSPDSEFSARYVPKTPLLRSNVSPYDRRILLAGEEAEASARNEKKRTDLSSMISGYLLRDLITPLGRSTDTRRANLLASSVEPTNQTIGMYRLTWPKRSLIQKAALRLCHRLVQSWLAKDTKPFQEPIRRWSKEQWSKRGFEPERIIGAFRATVEGALDRTPEAIFSEMYERFAEQLPAANDLPDPDYVQGMLNMAEGLVGRPEGETPGPQPAVLVEAMEPTTKKLYSTYDHKLAEMAVYFVEQPRYRFAGAEEAMRQFGIQLQQVVEQQEKLCNELVTKSQQAYKRIVAMIEGLRSMTTSGRRRPFPVNDLKELFRIYPTVRLQGLILQRVISVYRSLLGNCPEYLREFTYCRARLADLVTALEKPTTTVKTTEIDQGPSRALFAANCQNLEDAVTHLVKSVSSEELHEVEQRIQALIKRQFTALVHVCTTPANLLRDLRGVLEQEMESFLSGRVGMGNVLETFLDQNRLDAAAREEISSAYSLAAPKLVLDRPSSFEEIGAVLVPDESGAEKFRDLASQELADAEVVICQKSEDIVFYREYFGMALDQLPQLGPQAKEYYDQRLAANHFTPHIRIDIPEWND